MILTQQQKDEIYQHTLIAYPGVRRGRCLAASIAAIQYARAHFGVELHLQAGSMLWPIIREADDDGVRNTHWGYQWSPDDPHSTAALLSGNLPEIHVWLYQPATDGASSQIIDLTTGNFPTEAILTAGMHWQRGLPPPYIWCDPAELGSLSPDGLKPMYHHSIAATRFAMLHALRVFQLGF